MKLTSPLWSPIVLLALSVTAAGQEESDEGGAPLPPLPETLRPSADDPRAEMQRLFHQVELNLKRIDVVLNDVGAGDIPLEAPPDSGLDDLLRQTQADSAQIISDIDRILEIASQMGGTTMAPPSQEGDSPLDQPRSPGEQQRESTPQAPDRQGGEQNEGESHQGPPESPRDSKEQGENQPGAPHEPEQGDPAGNDPDSDEWGMLPPRTREVFRNEGNDDLPVQYRDWIDAYYRRLNETRP